jgi:hypothetical protein
MDVSIRPRTPADLDACVAASWTAPDGSPVRLRHYHRPAGREGYSSA